MAEIPLHDCLLSRCAEKGSHKKGAAEMELQDKTLAEWCAFFGWQGGTIHQVMEALKRKEGRALEA